MAAISHVDAGVRIVAGPAAELLQLHPLILELQLVGQGSTLNFPGAGWSMLVPLAGGRVGPPVWVKALLLEKVFQHPEKGLYLLQAVNTNWAHNLRRTGEHIFPQILLAGRAKRLSGKVLSCPRKGMQVY